MRPTADGESAVGILCLGECWSVVGPAGVMCTDDLGDQFLHQRVGVVVGEGGSPFRVFARLVLVAAHPLERLGEIGDRVEWNPHHVHLGHFGDERCFLGVPVGDGGSHLAHQLGEDVVAIPLFVESQPLGQVRVFAVNVSDVELMPDIDQNG
jgi:hypothetical protein